MLPRGSKNRFFWLEETKTDDGSEFERAFRGAVQFALDSGFSNILELKPVQEEALLHFIKRKDVFAVLPTGCGKSLIFQIVPRVRAYLHDRGFNFPKAAVSVVVCPLTALIDAHIKELKDHANLANKNYCPSIRRKENSEILHSRKLIGLFKAISIFLTSMEEVILSISRYYITNLQHTLCKNYLNDITLFTDVNLSTGVIETLFTKFAIPHFDIIAPFYASLPHMKTCQITKTNRSQKRPVWRAILFQNRLEVRFETAVTTGVFFPARHDRGFIAQFSPQTTGKKSLWHPG